MPDLCLHDKIRFIWENKGTDILGNEHSITYLTNLLVKNDPKLHLFWFFCSNGDIAGVASFEETDTKTVDICTVFKYPGCLHKVIDICATTFKGFKYTRTRKGKQKVETLESFGRLARALKL